MSGAPAAETPAFLGQYRILRRLGAGGMAEVFLARREGAEGTFKQLVIKRVLPHHGQSRRFRAMFVAEAQLATRLNHPNIVQVYDFEDIGEEGQLLTMEYVEGPDLGRVLAAARGKSVRLPPWVSAHILAEAARGLHYAHERKDDGGVPLAIVHRDVSPQNILLSWDGAVKIADFGIASANLFREEGGLLKGKFGYMSPEQARGDAVDRRSDIYALGVCLHEMLTGRPLHGPLGGDDLLEAVRSGQVEPPSTYARDVAPELEAIVMRALARSRDDRFQTARDMAGAISRVMLARQELIDAPVLEAVLTQLVGREVPVPRTAIGIESSTGGSAPSVPPAPAADEEAEATGASTAHERKVPPRGAREVRHVAVVTLRLTGLDVLGGAGGRAGYVLERIRKTLGDIAYKRGTEWQWEGQERARAVVGLLSNSSRAASEAAWLAVDAHEALAGASEDLPTPLGASVAIVRGVASGEREEDGRLVRYTLLPPAEYLAALLGERAPTDSTWVAGGLYRMIRREFRWGDAPLVEVPQQASLSLPRAMRVYALERPLSREERIDEAGLAPSDLVGRDAEKADLQGAFHRAISPEGGGPGMLVNRAVVGEMGIGKTALISAFMAELPPDTRLMRLEAGAARGDLPFGAIGEMVRDVLGVEPEASREQLRERVSQALGTLGKGGQGEATIGRLVELMAGSLELASDVDDATMRRRMVGASVRRLLAALASERPLVIVCDGLQWVDRTSLELIAELVRREDPLPILTLLVTRPDERVLAQLEGIVRIDLEGLSRGDQIRLVEARLGVRRGVEVVCAELLPRVAGNPFFLLEMVDALLERGALELQPGPDGEGELVRIEQGQVPLPSTLEQILGDRLRELSTSERALVDWLSVAGGPLSLATLRELMPADERDEEEVAVSRLCARGLCDQRGDQLDVRHSITRDVAYQALEPARRQRLHRRFGELLRQTGAVEGLAAAVAARHLARGDAREQAAELYLRAADAARRAHQTQLGVRYFHKALDLLPPDDARRLDAHESLEAAFRMMGRRRERKEQLAALRSVARVVAQPRWVAVALVRSARFDLDEGNLDHGIRLARQAAEVAKLAHAPVLEVEAHATASELLRELGDLPGALEACTAAQQVADAHHEVPARGRAEVMRARGAILRRLGRVNEAVEAYAEAIAVFRRCGARRLEARARNSLAMAMLVSERWEDAIALALEAVNLDLSIGSRFQIAKTLTNIGTAYARLGDLPRSLAYLRRAREAHGRYGDQDSLADTLLVSAEVILASGDIDAAHGLCTEAAALSTVTRNGYDAVHEKIVRALIARAHNDPASAVSCALEARQEAEGQALSSFHLYATAIESLCHVEAGEAHTGVLLASTVLGVVDVVPSEYGIEARSLACEALSRAGAPNAREACMRAAQYVQHRGDRIRDPRLRSLFFQRPTVRGLLDGALLDTSRSDSAGRGGFLRADALVHAPHALEKQRLGRLFDHAGRRALVGHEGEVTILHEEHGVEGLLAALLAPEGVVDLAVDEVDLARVLGALDAQGARFAAVPEHLHDVGQGHLAEAAADAAGAGLDRALLEHLLDLGDQQIAVGRLGHEVEHAEAERALRVLAVLAARQDHPRHVLAPRVLARLLEQGKPVGAAEFELADDHLDLARLEHLDGLVGGARDLHEEALLHHAQLEHGRLLRVGVDEQRHAAVAEQAPLDVVARDRQLEEVDQVGVEDGVLVAGEHVARLERPQCLAEGVARVLREVGVGVGDGEQAAAERDVLAARLAGQTAAVVALVHRLDGGEGGLGQAAALHEAARRGEGLLGRDAVALVLADVERGQVVGAHLAEIVQVGGRHDRARLARPEADALAELAHQAGHVARVPAQVSARVLDEAHQHVERLEVALGRHAAGRSAAATAARVLRQLVGRDGPLAEVRVGQVARDLLVAQQVALVDVEHRRELLVGRAVERTERMDVAAVGLADGRLHGRRASDERAQVLEVGRQLQLAQRLEVVRVRRHDRQRVGVDVVQHREDLVLLGELARHLVEGQPVDVRLGQLLGADEARLVQRRDELQEVGLADRVDLEQRLLDAAAEPVQLRDGRFVLGLIDLARLEQQVGKPVERGAGTRGG